MEIPGCLVAMVSNFARSVLGPERVADELDYQINQRMRQLYREGHRRFRVVSMPVTGDSVRRLVMGWPN